MARKRIRLQTESSRRSLLSRLKDGPSEARSLAAMDIAMDIAQASWA